MLKKTVIILSALLAFAAPAPAHQGFLDAGQGGPDFLIQLDSDEKPQSDPSVPS